MVPQENHDNCLNFTIMKEVKLLARISSNVVAMAHCPKHVQSECGIMYRSA